MKSSKLTPVVRIVDDDEKVLASEAFLVNMAGFRTSTYNSAKEFLDVNFQRFPTLDAKKLVNAPKMSAHHRGICHF